jgi:two-component system chemotaxis response regulator CheY
VKAIVIDDSRTIRMVLKRALTTVGFDTIHEAGDGREGLNKLNEVGPVDLAMVDWNMPIMDGLDFVTELRKLRQFDKVRVVMVTTESEEGKIARAMAAGANQYIMKPFTPDKLKEKLDAMGGFGKPGG